MSVISPSNNNKLNSTATILVHCYAAMRIFISMSNTNLLQGSPTVLPQLYSYRGEWICRSSLWVNWIYTNRAVHTSCCQTYSVRMECQTANRTNPWPHETFMILYCVKKWPFHVVDTYVLVDRATAKSRSMVIICVNEAAYLTWSGWTYSTPILKTVYTVQK